MNNEFWQQCWQDDNIGFHQADVNGHLMKFFPEFSLSTDKNVFVPLCGKTLDMAWLMQKNMHVWGIDISALAIEAFLAEQKITALKKQYSEFTVYEAKNLTLFIGDFFALSPTLLPNIDFVYDRSALIALPQDMREKYAAHLLSLLPMRCRLLLLTYDYAEKNEHSPPFAVNSAEIARLYGAAFSINLLTEKPTTLTTLSGEVLQGQRQVYILTKQ